jgi:hypothetical protein
MNNAGRYVFLIFVLPLMGLLGSCLGISSEIAIGRDGSGTITLEYRLSRMVESLGKLDGNERWLPVPVGQADFERTADRIEGLKVASFSSRTSGEDLINTVKLEFAHPGALVRFLDATGQRAAWTREQGGNRLTLSLGGGAEIRNPDLRELTAGLSEGYVMHFGLTLPGTAETTLRDSRGGALEQPPVGTLRSQGGRVVFSSPMADMLSSPQTVTMEIRW